MASRTYQGYTVLAKVGQDSAGDAVITIQAIDSSGIVMKAVTCFPAGLSAGVTEIKDFIDDAVSRESTVQTALDGM